MTDIWQKYSKYSRIEFVIVCFSFRKTETCKLYSRVFRIFLPNAIEIDRYDFELYVRLKVGAFFLRHSVYTLYLQLFAIWESALFLARRLRLEVVASSNTNALVEPATLIVNCVVEPVADLRPILARTLVTPHVSAVACLIYQQIIYKKTANNLFNVV